MSEEYQQYTKSDTILVRIASYRDFELPCTLTDLFAKAKRPDNLVIALCHQYDLLTNEDKEIFCIPFPRPKQYRTKVVDYRESRGLGWARRQCQLLYKGERWTISLDSHMRFKQNWDEILVLQLKQLIHQGYKKPILTFYPAGYNLLTGAFESDAPLRLGVSKISDNGIFRAKDMSSNLQEIKKYPLTVTLLGGCYITIGQHNQEVPYDEYIRFFDESDIVYRSWLHGYDIFNGDNRCIFHLYDTPEVLKQRRYPLHSSSQEQTKQIDRSISLARQKKRFKIIDTHDPKALQDWELYTQDETRDWLDFQRFSGFDFRKCTYRMRTKLAMFIPYTATTKTPIITKLFANLYGLKI